MQMNAPNRKGKPFERMGYKAFDLTSSLDTGRLSFDKKSNDQRLRTNDEYGGRVAEVEVGAVSYLTPLCFVISLLEVFSQLKTLKA